MIILPRVINKFEYAVKDFFIFIQAQVLRSLQKNITEIVRHYCDDSVIVGYSI